MGLRALFFLDVPHRLAGGQRSLLAALQRIAAHGVDPLVVFPGPGMCVDAYRAAGLRTVIVPAPDSLMVFGKKYLKLGLVRRAFVLLGDVIPYCRTLAELVARESIDVLHFNSPRAI